MKPLGILVLVGSALVAACGDRTTGPAGQVLRTGAPGHVAAGGRTSGEVMAGTARPTEPGSPGPAGTPGIPQGSGGTTGGAGLVVGPSGATVQQSPPLAPPMDVRSEKDGSAPASEDVKTGRNLRPPGVNADAPAAAKP